MTTIDSGQTYVSIDDLSVTLSDGVLSATMNRPDSLNSLTADMLAGIADAMAQAATDPFQFGFPWATWDTDSRGWNAACPVYPAPGYYSDESVKSLSPTLRRPCKSCSTIDVSANHFSASSR